MKTRLFFPIRMALLNKMLATSCFLLAMGSGAFAQAGCNKIAPGSVQFASGSSKITATAQKMLHDLALSMKSNPSCKVVVSSYTVPSKTGQQNSWDRVNAIIRYEVDKEGIDGERFIFMYGASGGDPNTVDIRVAKPDEEGPSKVPPPFPNLQRTR